MSNTKTSPKDVEKHLRLIESLEKNYYLVEEYQKTNSQERKLADFNHRLVLSECVSFLEAVQKDMGGEILTDQALGSFLYFEE